jgi:hypothetical protein
MAAAAMVATSTADMRVASPTTMTAMAADMRVAAAAAMTAAAAMANKLKHRGCSVAFFVEDVERR